MEKIFGIGWAKTGTTTLGKCFSILGFKHQSARLDLVKEIAKNDLSKIIKLAEDKDAFEDWPWLILYKELDKAFPESRFILTERDPLKWIKSYKNMLKNQGKASDELNEIRRVLYGLPFPHVSEKQLIKRYKNHNEEVKKYFEDRPNSLLVVNWGNGDGWNKLCEFLGKTIPDEPFPHANRGKYTGSPVKRIISKIVNLIK